MSIETTMPTQRISLYSLLALSALAIGFFSMDPDFGTPDFQEYWSALRLFERGVDPYIPAHMSEFQRASFGRETPIMMWNPPWLLTLMYPLLQFDFLVSARLWLLAQLVLIGASVMIAVSLLRSDSLSPAGYLCILVASVSFPPCCNSLQVGQIGGLLLFGGSTVFWGLDRHSSWAVALGCAILSVKPHLFLLFGVVLLWWIVTEKRYSLVMQIGFVITGLALFSELIMPRSFGYWLESFGYRGSAIVPSKFQWAGNIWGVPFFEALVLALLICMAMLVWLIRNRPQTDWCLAYPPLVTLSVCFAPFGWFFDQSVGLVLLIPTLVIALERRRYLILMLAGCLQVIALFCLLRVARYHHEMSWYLPLIVLLWGGTAWKHRRREPHGELTA